MSLQQRAEIVGSQARGTRSDDASAPSPRQLAVRGFRADAGWVAVPDELDTPCSASRPGDWRRHVSILALLAATVCLTLGIFMPIIQLRKLFFWVEQHSLVSTIAALWVDGQLFLAIMVVVFSIVLPFLKLVYLLMLSALPDEELRRIGGFMTKLEWLGRLSMHDVLVLALTIFFLKTSGLYDASSLQGVYLYTSAVVLIMASSGLLHGKLGRLIETTRRVGTGDGEPGGFAAESSWGARFWRLFLSLLVISGAVTLALGIFLPAIKFTTAYVWAREHSILSIIKALWASSELFLGAVVFCVSVVFPVFKLWYLLLLVLQPALEGGRRRFWLTALEWLGRYSMTDVMVVALMIFYVNSSGYVEARVLSGLYWFAASACLTMLAYAWLGAGLRHTSRTPAPVASST